jgi:glucose/arabinose dehydrogenase
VRTAEESEGGLLGIALHPQVAENRSLYLYFTAPAAGGGSENRIERWRLAPDHARAALDRVLLAGIPASPYHNGGRLRFGPDGMLYAGTGYGDDPDRSQQPASPNGKILRLTPDGAPAPGNPQPGNPMFILGVRNAEAFDWLDPRTLIIADHGPSMEMLRKGADEVDIAGAGANLGWPSIYGCQQRAGMTSPVLSWTGAMPPGGGAIYTGTEIPEWKGSFLVGTLKSRHLHRVVVDAGRHVTHHEVYFKGEPPQGLGRLREVIMGPDGQLYVTTSNCDGRGTCPPAKDSLVRIRRRR